MDNVTPFIPRDAGARPPQRTRLLKQLRATTVVDELAFHVHRADVALGLPYQDAPAFDELPSPARATVVERATIAVQLGDPVKRAMADVAAAAAIRAGIRAAVNKGEIASESPTAHLGTPAGERDAMSIAHLAIAAAVRYLAGYPFAGDVEAES